MQAPRLAAALLVSQLLVPAPALSHELPVWPQPAELRASGSSRAVHPQLDILATASGNAVLDEAIARYTGLLRNHASAAAAPEDGSAQGSATLRTLRISIDRPEELELGMRMDESYELDIAAGSPAAELTARTAFGAIYGLESFLQLLSAEPGRIAAASVHIKDAPEWSWRGMMIDTGRRFWPVPLVKNTLDTMAAVKLNVLHLHVLDHCRFGVESKLFPELGAALTGEMAGAYSQQDIKELIKYAKARAIRIVPEFDLPAHARGLLPLDVASNASLGVRGVEFCQNASSEGAGHYQHRDQLHNDPATNVTLDTLAKLLGEMAELFDDPVMDIGGDETFTSECDNPRLFQPLALPSDSLGVLSRAVGKCSKNTTAALQTSLCELVSQTLGKTPAGWEELLFDAGAATPHAIIQAWGGSLSPANITALGRQAINSLSHHFYIGPCNGSTTWARAHADVGLGVPPSQRSLLLGGEMATWTDGYCPTLQCHAFEGPPQPDRAMFPPSQDAAFGKSQAGLLWPFGYVGAGSFWRYNASLDPTSAAFEARMWALNDQLAARGSLVCPSRCYCDNLRQCGQPLVPHAMQAEPPLKSDDTTTQSSNRRLSLPLRTHIVRTTGHGSTGGKRTLQQVDSAGLEASSSNGYSYGASVQIGMPPVSIAVNIDTGSSNLAVPASFCTNCAVDIASYDPAASATSSAMPCDSPRCDNTMLLDNPHCVPQPGGATCCASWRQPASKSGSTEVCLHHDGYIDGSGINGPVLRDTIQVGAASTTAYFKAFADDEGGVGIGNHFATSHSLAGIWGLALQDPENGDEQYGNGVFDMGSVLVNLLRDNALADQFALCYDDSPAMFTDDTEHGASSLDLGGPDPRKFTGRLQYVPLLDDWSGYSVAGGPIRLTSSAGDYSVPLASTVTVAGSDDCQDSDAAEGACSDYASLGWCDTSEDMYSNMQVLCQLTCRFCAGPGVQRQQQVEITDIIVDSGNTGTLGLPPAVMTALSSAMVEWFASEGAARTHACSAADLRKESAREADSEGYTCARFVEVLGCTEDTQALCPVSCHVCLSGAGEACTASADCGGGFFCAARTCQPCTQVGQQGGRERECRNLPSLAAELARALFAPDADSCIAGAARFATIDLDLFPTIALELSRELVVELPPDAYLEINNGGHICRSVDVYQASQSQSTSGMLGAGMLQQYYALFDRQHQQLGLAKRGDCTPGTDDADSSAATHCRARVSGPGAGCGDCVGPVDDLEMHRGYCEWCPTTRSCVAADPKSIVPACPQSMGFVTDHLDNAQGVCPDFEGSAGAVDVACQSSYQFLTKQVMKGGVRGACSADAQDTIDRFVEDCVGASIRMHINGGSLLVPGAGCVLSVMQESPHVHGMDSCVLRDPDGPNPRGTCTAATERSLCAYDATNCYGSHESSSASAGSATGSCSEGTEIINAACPPSKPGHTAPGSCPPACAAAFEPWWARCETPDVRGGWEGFPAQIREELQTFSSLCAEGGDGYGHRRQLTGGSSPPIKSDDDDLLRPSVATLRALVERMETMTGEMAAMRGEIAELQAFKDRVEKNNSRVHDLEEHRRMQAATCDLETQTAATMDACCPQTGGGGHRRMQGSSCDLPETCPSMACASVFLPFMAACDVTLSQMPGLQVEQFERFAASCQERQASMLQPVDVQMFRVRVNTAGAAQSGAMFPGGGSGLPLNPLQPLQPLPPPPPTPGAGGEQGRSKRSEVPTTKRIARGPYV